LKFFCNQNGHRRRGVTDEEGKTHTHTGYVRDVNKNENRKKKEPAALLPNSLFYAVGLCKTSDSVFSVCAHVNAGGGKKKYSRTAVRPGRFMLTRTYAG